MIAESFLIRPRGHLLHNLVVFARLLRSLGVAVTPDQIADLVTALPLLDLRSREEFRDASRAMLVTAREQAALFDRAFDAFWQAWTTDEAAVAAVEEAEEAPPSEPQDAGREDRRSEPRPSQPDEPQPDDSEALFTYSAREVLRHKDFAELDEDELRAVGQFMRAITWQPELRRTRRKRLAHRGSDLDLRQTLRMGLRYGGETFRLAWRRPKLKRRPLVVLCDISGSMERYSRVLLQFIYAITNGLERVETFAFSTRLTRVTRQLHHSNIDRALGQVSDAVNDWGGGTRIGESLKTFNYRWARRVLGQSATVLIISDGWDRGDLALLRREIARLQLSCWHLIWLNPLLGSPDYRPLAKGIQTVLPYVDDFLPVHNLASLEQLARTLDQAEARRSRIKRGRD